MKRLFVAADISSEARYFASDLIRKLRSEHPQKGVSWSKPENLHITIKFLGDTEPESEEAVIATLSRLAASTLPFRFCLDKPEVLGKRVVSFAVRSDTATIFSLEMMIDTECERLGFQREGRRFHPHLTLARIRQPEGTRELTKRFLQAHFEPLSFDVREIVLYESELGPGGSIYKMVKRFPLSASG